MNILFLCVANSSRSQMAEGLARKILGTEHTVQSAGSQPTKLNPFAVRAMREIGIDISHHSSKSVSNIDISKINLIITLCAEEVCPVVPVTVERLHWPIPDPAGRGNSDDETLLAFRAAREQIQQRLQELRRRGHLSLVPKKIC